MGLRKAKQNHVSMLITSSFYLFKHPILTLLIQIFFNSQSTPRTNAFRKVVSGGIKKTKFPPYWVYASVPTPTHLL